MHRGKITKQGSKLVRWAAVEAAQKAPTGTLVKKTFWRIGAPLPAHRQSAVARKILTLVFYGLRDGEVRA